VDARRIRCPPDRRPVRNQGCFGVLTDTAADVRGPR
jgi:hypothetical protein